MIEDGRPDAPAAQLVLLVVQGIARGRDRLGDHVRPQRDVVHQNLAGEGVGIVGMAILPVVVSAGHRRAPSPP